MKNKIDSIAYFAIDFTSVNFYRNANSKKSDIDRQFNEAITIKYNINVEI